VQVRRYEILEIIGTGPLPRGASARFHDRPSGGHQAFLQRTRRRAKAVCVFSRKPASWQLSHPSIMTLHDMGIEESTKRPIVMEFLEGRRSTASGKGKPAVSTGLRNSLRKLPKATELSRVDVKQHVL